MKTKYSINDNNNNMYKQVTLSLDQLNDIFINCCTKESQSKVAILISSSLKDYKHDDIHKANGLINLVVSNHSDDESLAGTTRQGLPAIETSVWSVMTYTSLEIDWLAEACKIQALLATPNETIQMARTLLFLGMAMRDGHQNTNAIPTIQNALRIMNVLVEPDSLELACAMEELAKCKATADFSDADRENIYQTVLNIKKRYYEENHIEMAITWVNASDVYCRHHRYIRYRQSLLEKAKPIIEQHYERNHLYTKILYQKLSTLYKDLQQNDGANTVQ